MRGRGKYHEVAGNRGTVRLIYVPAAVGSSPAFPFKNKEPVIIQMIPGVGLLITKEDKGRREQPLSMEEERALEETLWDVASKMWEHREVPWLPPVCPECNGILSHVFASGALFCTRCGRRFWLVPEPTGGGGNATMAEGNPEQGRYSGSS